MGYRTSRISNWPVGDGHDTRGNQSRHAHGTFERTFNVVDSQRYGGSGKGATMAWCGRTEVLAFGAAEKGDLVGKNAKGAARLLSPNSPAPAAPKRADGSVQKRTPTTAPQYFDSFANASPPAHQHPRAYSPTAGSETRSTVQNSRPAPQQLDRFADACSR